MIIHGGTVYDGTGAEAQQADAAIRGNSIAAIGPAVAGANAKRVMTPKAWLSRRGSSTCSWSTESLLQEGHSQSEIRQGVTRRSSAKAVDGSVERVRERDMIERARRHQVRRALDDTLSEYLSIWSTAVCRAMWHRSSVHDHARTRARICRSASRHRPSSTKCASWFAWRCAKPGRLGAARR